MEIEIFTLCDAAADYQGRLNIMGVFDSIFATQLPAIHPYCSVALRMRFERIERGQHRITLHIVDNDGVFVIPSIEGSFSVEMPDEISISSANLTINLGQLRFEKFGAYDINLAIDGRKEATLPFWVREAPKP